LGALGHVVGEWSKKLYPAGVEVAWGDFNETLAKTKEYVADGKTVFEASFLFGDCYCRVDILVPNGDGWDVVEVKSGTRVKDENVEDVAFQKYVLEGCGLKVKDLTTQWLQVKPQSDALKQKSFTSTHMKNPT